MGTKFAAQLSLGCITNTRVKKLYLLTALLELPIRPLHTPFRPFKNDVAHSDSSNVIFLYAFSAFFE